MNHDLADRIREQYMLVSPIRTKRVARRKKWHVLEVMERCYECGRTSYRPQWPWRTTYEDVPVSFMEEFSGRKLDSITTDFGEFQINV